MAAPLTLATRPGLRVPFCSAMYVCQGIPFGFVTVALAAWLAGHGGDSRAVGAVVAMAVLPWSFKWAWGPLVDSGWFAAAGRRRPWLVLAQAMMVASSLAFLLAAGDPSRLAWLVLLHNAFVGLQDVAIDAIAVDTLEGRQRERASGLMYAASYLGTMLGGAGLGILVARFGLSAGIVALAAAEAAGLVAAVVVRERPGDLLFFGLRAAPRPAAARPPALAALGLAMARPEALRTALAAFLLKVLPSLLSVTMTVELVGRLGWTEERFAGVSGGFGTMVGFAAAVAGGFLAAATGPTATLVAANSVLSAGWILLAARPSAWEHEMTIWLWFALHEGAMAMVTVALFALFMRVSTPAVAATQFTASMALMNLATSAGAWLAGPVGAALDAPGAFLAAGILQPLGVLLLPRPSRGAARVPPAAAALLLAIVACGSAAAAPPDDARRAEQLALMERETFWDNLDREWFLDNVPSFVCSDADITTTWWYRFELLTKHLTYGSPNTGYLFTEFLDRPFWSGAYGAISCPAGLQLAEARWLRSPRVARDYARYWIDTPGAQPRTYSTWLADAVWAVHLVHPARRWIEGRDSPAAADVFPLDILAGLEANDAAWHDRHFVGATGLYWQVGHDDGMEFNIASRQTGDILRGAPSYRPSFIAYRWADLRALARLQELAGNSDRAAEHRAAAGILRERMEEALWDERRGFFLAAFRDEETVDGVTVAAGSRMYDSGRFAGSPHGRELIGYVPWQFDMPTRGRGYESAWRFLPDPEFFRAPFGPSTVERHDPLFLLKPHCCWWSGQSWPYATSQTLAALAKVLQFRSPGLGEEGDDLQSSVTAADYVDLLATFARTHRKGGRPYLAEACHPDTGSFEGHDGYNHSEHYFHSSFVDLVITGLVGIVPRDDDTLEIRPLFPAAWEHLKLDRVVYRGREVGVVWDRDGTRHGLGPGLHLLAEGRVIASSAAVGRLAAALPPPAERLVAAGLVDEGQRPGLAPVRVNFAVNNDGTYFPRVVPSSTAPDTSPSRLADGVAWYLRSPPNRWESAVPDEEAVLVVDLGTPRRIDSVALLALDDTPALLAGTADAAVPGRDASPSDVRAPAAIALEAEVDGSWRPLEARSRVPAEPAGHLANRISFAPLEVARVRVRLRPRPGSRVGLAELEVWGEATPPVGAAPPPAGNLALATGGEYPRASASHTSRYDRVDRAIDGIVSYQTNPNNRWTAYESPNASDWLEIDFGQARRVARVELAIYDDRGGVQPPETFHVEVWRDGVWTRAAGERHAPERPLGNALNESRFEPTTTEKLRVVFTHRGPSRSGVSEVFVWED